MDIFSERLKWLREKYGKTQKEVAEYMGVSQQYYGRFEKGQGQPNLEALSKLSALFDEPLEFLLGNYHLDNHAAMLFAILRRHKRLLEKNQQRLQEFFDFIKKEDVDDQELKERISAILLKNRKGGSERANYLKAKKHFIDYAVTIPGLGEIDDEYIQKLYDYQERKTSEQSLLHTQLLRELFEDNDDE